MLYNQNITDTKQKEPRALAYYLTEHFFISQLTFYLQYGLTIAPNQVLSVVLITFLRIIVKATLENLYDSSPRLNSKQSTGLTLLLSIAFILFFLSAAH